MEGVRRGGVTNRFFNKLFRKSKKRMLKKLGLADADENMNHRKQEKMIYYKCPASDLETNVSSKKKKNSELPKKDTNGVDHHASVPRKLRSAMKKRNLESVSASKRLNQSKPEIETLNMDLVQKQNQEMDAKANVPESISKDEKEVAETLYGLAVMFTDSNSNDNKTSDPLLSDGKETIKVDSTLVVESDFTTKAKSLEPTTSFLSSAIPKQIDEEPLQQLPNQRSLTGLKHSSSVNVTNAPLSTRAIETKVATSDYTDHKSNGLALWPGLSSSTESGYQVLSRSSSTKLPHWMMGQAVSPTKNASLLSETLRARPRKLKKCASHIYICRLIKALQTNKSSPVALLNQTVERSLELSQCRLPDPVRTMVAPSKSYQNPHLLDLGKTHNPKPVQENMTQLGLELYAPHTTEKQNYDFLSLSSQSQFPFPNSFPQNPIYGAYNSQLTPATSSHQMQQMSPYLASRFQTAYIANHHQWVAQYRPLTSRNTLPPLSTQYSKPSLSLNLTSIQPLHVASSPRYINNISQQQYRLMAASAAAMSMSHRHSNNLSRSVMNRQEHHFPLIYEDTRTSLQLLCNEQS